MHDLKKQRSVMKNNKEKVDDILLYLFLLSDKRLLYPEERQIIKDTDLC